MRGRRRKEVDTELNIITFLNLMVILIPFLLMSAAFTQLSVLDLNLPSAAAPDQNDTKSEPKPAFEVTVSEHFLVLGNRNQTKVLPAGILKVIEKSEDAHNFKELNATLKRIKESFPEIEDITILLEEETPYNLLIQTMDSVRVEVSNGNEYELFPGIAIGDAPADAIKQLNARYGKEGA